MIPLQSPLCLTCQHFKDLQPRGKVYRYICVAFPEGIPDEYRDWETDRKSVV